MIPKSAVEAMIRTDLSHTRCPPHQLRIPEIGKLRSRDTPLEDPVQNTTRRTFTKLVAASAAIGLVPPLSAQEDDKLQSRFLANLVIEIDAGL
jgi:hypothetical protein